MVQFRDAIAAWQLFDASFAKVFPRFNSDTMDGWPEVMYVKDGVHYLSYMLTTSRGDRSHLFQIDNGLITKVSQFPDDAVLVGDEEIFALEAH